MIKEICIENYKSIQELKIELGRVTVFIGENGCGKTNILEAIALSAAAASDKLDNEFLASRGIRVTEPQFMRSAFNIDNLNQEIKISLQFQTDKIITYNLQHDGKPYSSWVSSILSNQEILVQMPSMSSGYTNLMYEDARNLKEIFSEEIYQGVLKFLLETDKNILNFKSFLIFSPQNSRLRIFNEEGQIQPLGIEGEGLFKLLTVLNLEENQGLIEKVKEKFKSLIGEDFYVKYNQRIIFAITVHSIECWLLPLYYRDNRKEKVTNCLNTLNQELVKRERFTIDANNKNPEYYRKVSSQYSKHKGLMKFYQENPSLKIFIQEIEKRYITIENDG